MAYDVTQFTDYVSRSNDVLTATLFTGGDTGKFALFMAGVKGKESVPHIGGAATLQAGNCKTPSGTTNVSEIFIEVKAWTFYEGFCEDDLQKKFPNMVLAAGSSNADSPKGWQEKVIDVKIASMQETLELTNWQGDTTTGSYQLFDGYIKLIDAAAGTIDGNTSNATAITKANVIGLVDDMYVSSPTKVKRSGEMVILAGDDVFDLYIAAQKAANQYHYDAEHDNGVLKLGGSRGTLQRVYGLDGTDRMFASKGSNFIVGADVEEEEKIVKVWYDETDDKVYLRSKGKSGVTIANPTEIVEFTLAV